MSKLSEFYPDGHLKQHEQYNSWHIADGYARFFSIKDEKTGRLEWFLAAADRELPRGSIVSPDATKEETARIVLSIEFDSPDQMIAIGETIARDGHHWKERVQAG